MPDERLAHYGQAMQQMADRIAEGVFGTVGGNGSTPA
jgi:hypothetical protein